MTKLNDDSATGLGSADVKAVSFPPCFSHHRRTQPNAVVALRQSIRRGIDTAVTAGSCVRWTLVLFIGRRPTRLLRTLVVGLMMMFVQQIGEAEIVIVLQILDLPGVVLDVRNWGYAVVAAAVVRRRAPG